jgi:hypothetical protein
MSSTENAIVTRLPSIRECLRSAFGVRPELFFRLDRGEIFRADFPDLCVNCTFRHFLQALFRIAEINANLAVSQLSKLFILGISDAFAIPFVKLTKSFPFLVKQPRPCRKKHPFDLAPLRLPIFFAIVLETAGKPNKCRKVLTFLEALYDTVKPTESTKSTSSSIG